MYILCRSGWCTLPHCLLAMSPEQPSKLIVDDVSVRVKTFSREQSRNTCLFKVKTLNLYIGLSITNELHKYPDTFLNLKLKTIHKYFLCSYKRQSSLRCFEHCIHMRSHDSCKACYMYREGYITQTTNILRIHELVHSVTLDRFRKLHLDSYHSH